MASHHAPATSDGPLTLVVILTVRNERVDEFRAFEAQAARALAKHGGQIVRTVVIPPASTEASFKEVHIVTVPNEEALRAYRQDASLRELAEVRAACVLDTEILVGEDGPDYG